MIIIRYESADGLSLEEEWEGEFPTSDTIIRHCHYALTNVKREQRLTWPERRYVLVEKTHYGYRYREIESE